MRAFCSRYTFHFNALRNYLRKLERRPKWQHIRFTYDILSFLWSVQPLRVTPAYTGEKHNYPVFSCGTTRHPRACGEKTSRGPGSSAAKGSPPRMRGKEVQILQRKRPKRITPAHAGKSSYERATMVSKEDHPRACGEKLQFPQAARWKLGSPPRMRGKAGVQPGRHRREGITPAHAGKRFCWTESQFCPRDHPRACGEKVKAMIKNFRGWGSPPRMRGKVVTIGNADILTGITPAHAGKSGIIDCSANASKDHPRACGEKNSENILLGLRRGSPPRMRGKVYAAYDTYAKIRITPAHAGKRDEYTCAR